MVDTALFGQAELSGTNITVSTGVKTFILEEDNGVIDVDYTLQIVPYAEPGAWMYGVVTAKNGLEVTVSIFKTSEMSGEYRNWSLQVIAGPFAGLPASQTLGFSTDSAAVPTVGDKLDWTIEPGKAFYDNSTIYVSAVNDSTAFFFATVIDYDSVDGSISLVVNRVSGSGTFALWSLSLIDVTQSFWTQVGDSDYTILPSDKTVALIQTLSTPRTWTLPLAASVPKGYVLIILDSTNAVATHPLTVVPVVGEFLNSAIGGSGAEATLAAPFFTAEFISNGINRWTINRLFEGVFGAEAVFIQPVEFASTVGVFGATTLSGGLNVVGQTTVDNLQVDADADITGNLGVTGDVTLSGDVLEANLRDSTTTFFDSADATKTLRFQLSGITTGTLRTATWPDENITVVGEDSTQTLRNKTLTDVSTVFAENTDLTKTLRFQLSGLTTGTLRIVTWPDANLTVVGTTTTQTLTNKTLTDATTTFADNADNTKTLQFQLSGIATGTLRTVTWPDADLTVVGLTTTQTLTNKTLTSPAINTPTITTPEINGLATVDALRSFSFTIEDDTAVSITPPTNSAFILAFVTTTSLSATAPAGTIGGRTNAADTPALIASNDATNIEFSTATLAGTTGTDGKLTFSCPGDGNIYIENRLGAQRVYRFTLLCN